MYNSLRNKHPAHWNYKSLYKHEIVSLRIAILNMIDCLHITAEYRNLAVCRGKLGKRKLVQSESDMFTNRLLKPMLLKITVLYIE